MIEVVTFSASGAVIDRAEAEDPEAAVTAARTLAREAREVPGFTGLVIQGIEVTVRFYVDGEMVREIEGRRIT
jgi:hypothetical protein